MSEAPAASKIPLGPKENVFVLVDNSANVDGNVLKWIDGWLCGRRQRVVLNGQVSEWTDILSGVPRGICFRPDFVCYTY